jgi:hypothetical protein
VYKWGAITFGIGILLVVIEMYHSSRKKDGITATDWQRIRGIFWLACVASLGVMALIWIA